MIEKKHIFLTGFMGSGKSTVSAKLADLLKRPLLDMDSEIERQFKMPVSEVFAKHGEQVFRQAENRLLGEIALLPHPHVVACGGGSVLASENRQIMDAVGSRVFLNTPLATIKQRMAKEMHLRPLWQNEEDVAQLFSQRAPVYKSAAYQITGEGAPAEIVQNLAAIFFAPMQASLKDMNIECQLLTAWSNVMGEVAEQVDGHKCLLLLDKALAHQALNWQNAGIQAQTMARRGEALKTFAQVQKVLKLMAQQSLARDDYLIVRGGGCLTDMGAFCAGLYKRGLNLVLVATTLLAAVDAAVGGKTAINFNGVKNQVGHFYLPRKVIIDIGSFASLRPAQLVDGLIEAYKTGLVGDEQLAAFIEDNLEMLKKGDLPYLAWVAGRAMQIKASLVQKDFREQLGIRDALNFGHTFGHVVESWSNYKVSHGRAVAAGMIVAVNLSRKKANLQTNDAQRIINTIKQICKLPALPSQNEVAGIMRQDKKYRSGKMGFILLDGPGKPLLTHALKLNDVLDSAYGDSVV